MRILTMYLIIIIICIIIRMIRKRRRGLTRRDINVRTTSVTLSSSPATPIAFTNCYTV